MIEILEDDVERFFKFITRRHLIYVKRHRGDPWPWTNDKILQEYKFTNIFRELDTGTIWCREHIREPYADDPNLFFNIALYRLYNWIPTAEVIGYVHNKGEMEEVEYKIREMAKRGEQIFTGAHMITGTLGGDKIHQVFDLCLHALWKNRGGLQPEPEDTLEQAFNRLNKKSPGFGPFIAYEVISDLRHTRYLCEAKDIMTWANAGPGCMRGMNRLAHLPTRPKKQLDVDQYLTIMQELLALSEVYLPEWMPSLEMRDIEHSLCEFDKYERTRLGEGRPRSRFVPPHLRSDKFSE